MKDETLVFRNQFRSLGDDATLPLLLNEPLGSDPFSCLCNKDLAHVDREATRRLSQVNGHRLRLLPRTTLLASINKSERAVTLNPEPVVLGSKLH